MNTVITSRIYLDDTAAQLAYTRLEQKADAYTAALKAANTEGKRKDIERQLELNAAEMEKVKAQIDSGLKPSYNQLRAAVTQLERELKKLPLATKEFAIKAKELEGVRKQFDAVDTKVKGLGRSMKDFYKEVKTVAAGVVVGNTVQSAIQSITGYFSGAVNGAAKLSDELSNIRKAANLSQVEVEKLNSQIGKIDTRTSNSDLRQVAEGLGQVGEAVTPQAIENIDKLVVALGDEFGGGAKQITTEVSILRNNLQDIKTGNYSEDVLRIGNALNELGAKGLATAPVVTDFANRMAGVAGTFGLSSAQILGTAATLQELGVSVERGATAFTKSLQKIAADPIKFATALGYTKQQTNDFIKLVNTDLGAAFNQVAVDARKAGTSNVAFGNILKELDADGSGAGEVLSKLAKNQELLTDKVNLSTEALKNTDSITNEFTIKNTNLAAILAKTRKEFESYLQSPAVTNFLVAAVKGSVNLLKILIEIPKWLYQNRTAIIILTAAYVAYNAQKIRAAVLSRIEAIQNAVTTASLVGQNAATLLLTASKALLVGNIKKAGEAFKALWLVLRSNPLGLILTVVGLAVVAFNAFKNKTKELTDEQKKLKRETALLAEVEKNAAEMAGQQAAKLKLLKEAAESTVLPMRKRLEAVQELKKEFPDYFANLNTEQILTGKVGDAYQRAADGILAKARAQATSNKIAELATKEFEAQSKIDAINKKYLDNYNKVTQNGKLKVIGATPFAFNDADYKSNIQLLGELRSQMDLLSKKALSTEQSVKSLINTATDNGIKAPTTTDNKETATSNAAEKLKAEQDRLKQLAAELEKMRFEQMLLDQTDKDQEIIRTNAKYEELLKQAKGHHALEKQIKELHALELLRIDNKFAEIDKKNAAEKLKQQLEFDEEVRKRAVAALLAKSNSILAEQEIAAAKQLANKKAAAELQVLRSTGLKKLQAQLAQLALEKQTELANKELTEQQKLLIEQKYNDAANELVRSSLDKIVQQGAQILQQAIAVYEQFGQARANRENAELLKYKTNSDRRKQILARQLADGVISQQQYHQKVAALDEAFRKKEHEAKVKQFRREQKMKIANALINGALAVSNIWATTPKADFGITTGILLGLSALSTIASVAAIASEKPPEYARGGYMASGEKHSGKYNGMHVVNPSTGRTVAYTEAGEGWINRRSMADNRTFTISGTPGQIASAVNTIGGGVSFMGGASLHAYSRSYKPFNYAAAQRTINKRFMYEKGGIMSAANSVANAAINDNSQQQIQLSNALIEALLIKMEQPFKSYVVYKDIEDSQARLNAVKQSARLN